MAPSVTGRPVPVHRLRPNESVWTPPSVIFWDTESCWADEGPDEVHRLRLWVACLVDRRPRGRRPAGVKWAAGTTAAELADRFDSWMVGRECVWAYAHNVGFDLAVTDLAGHMAARGWEVKDFAVAQGSPWLRVGRKRKTLTLLDSWSWLPERLDSLAARMGERKSDLPAADAETGEWLGRCAKDVELLARAVLDLMAWWDRERLGHWTISGAGCGWNAMRHTASPTRHVIDVTPELVAQDRLAVRGGRKDAAVIRSDTGGPWVEVDLEAAYPTVARDLPLPVKRGWVFDRLPLDTPFLRNRFHGVVAEAVVRTDRPRYPVRHGRVTWFPVGCFRTVLAGPELAWARDNGDLVEIGAGQAHRLGDALAPWADWVMDPSRQGTVDVPPVALVATRHWGRATLGKFAARSHTSTRLEGVAPAGWGVVDSWDSATGRKAGEVRMGGRAFYVVYDGDTENCYPAVLAWVESYVRVRLGRVLEALDGAWWTCDTDGLLLDMGVVGEWLRWNQLRLGDRPRDPVGLAQAVCDELAPLVAPLRLRPKKQVDSLRVFGPQHTVRDGRNMMSGVRAQADEIRPNTWRARDWPGLKWQIQHGQPGTYRRPERTATFTAPTVHRWVLDSGETRPVEMRIGADGANELVPWSESRWAGDDPAPTMPQYRLLPPVT